eukprot:scaffold2017_cov71-Phaeocystis_antarctica.AAC.5
MPATRAQAPSCGSCGQPKLTARGAHLGQRLPAIGLRIVHLRRGERLTYVSNTAHSVQFAIKSDAAVQGAWTCHGCQPLPRSVLRVVQLHRAEPSVFITAAHNVDQAGPEAPTRQRSLKRDERSGQQVPPILGVERRPSPDGDLEEPLCHRREAHVLHHGKQLSLRPLGGLPPPHAPLEDGLLALGHQLILLYQHQHLRARRQLRRQLLEAAQRHLHSGLLERRQREGVGEPPHVERVGRREPRADRVGTRVLERVDHQARGRLEHLGQQALVDLTFALVDEGQQRLEHRRADALERVGRVRRVAHARFKQV